MTPLEQPPTTGILRRVARIITVIELTIGAVAVLMILVLVFYQALQRYLPFESLAWTGELARFALLWATFAAMGLLVTSRGHIALELVDSIRNPMTVSFIQVFALLVVAAAAIGLSLEAWALISTQGIVKSPVLRIPMSWVYVPVFIGTISTTVRALISAGDVALHGPKAADIEDDQVEVAGL
ncbi:TRAP transporter small permease [Microbacterium murale]|uniref:TRAP-type C4-dicarboxylate transport system permease small subunit n=1 Tax=Microbacterium murale TaxID=1081040 RepID=A0ABU0PA92_9MICO|nr:TRAP transporter small permease subunit [Microbacterium murale]MDQ0643852.1 TRAP-type C4-dicarboxylate transport system permease small subunit [Microbacterium murale]